MHYFNYSYTNVYINSVLSLFLLQEEEKRKRIELEQIMAENNRKIEEAQKKLVYWISS